MNTNEIEKGGIILRPGQICNAVYRVINGCLKSYVLDKSGKEHILQFAPEQWLIADLNSFTNNLPSKIFIEAVEASKVEIISYTMLDVNEMDNETLINMYSKFQNNVIATNKRLISLLSSTAEERYVEFTQTYPQLVQRLPLKLIASYLGMTPEHLSYTRGRLTKKS